MKLSQILLFAGAMAAPSEDDERFKNPIKKIEKLKGWGEGKNILVIINRLKYQQLIINKVKY